MRARRLVVPPPSRLESMLARPDQVAAALRLYRRTPAPLRRPQLALRVGVAVMTTWFTLLFGALAVFTTRTAAGGAFHRGPSWAYAYVVAAALGPIGLALFLTRRHRAGVGALAAMFVLGQIATLAAIL
jgi:hypothetical protein